MTLHTYNPPKCLHQVSTSYTIRILRYSPDNMLNVKATIAVKGQIDMTRSLPTWKPTNVPNKYFVSTFYTLQISRCRLDKILKVKATTARSKGKSTSYLDISHLHLYQLPTPYVSKIQARQDTVSYYPPGCHG